eukprot:IDg19638t1
MASRAFVVGMRQRESWDESQANSRCALRGGAMCGTCVTHECVCQLEIRRASRRARSAPLGAHVGRPCCARGSNLHASTQPTHPCAYFTRCFPYDTHYPRISLPSLASSPADAYTYTGRLTTELFPAYSGTLDSNTLLF